VQYAKTVHDSRPPTTSPGMVYATYDFYLLIKYRYLIDIAIFWQYRIEFQKKQYRCITGQPFSTSLATAGLLFNLK